MTPHGRESCLTSHFGDDRCLFRLIWLRPHYERRCCRDKHGCRRRCHRQRAARHPHKLNVPRARASRVWGRCDGRRSRPRAARARERRDAAPTSSRPCTRGSAVRACPTPSGADCNRAAATQYRSGTRSGPPGTESCPAVVCQQALEAARLSLQRGALCSYSPGEDSEKMQEILRTSSRVAAAEKANELAR